jgi:hypothetical protein
LLGVEGDIADSFTKMMNAAASQTTKSALVDPVKDTKRHIEVLESICESLEKILVEDQRHARVLEGLAEE